MTNEFTRRRMLVASGSVTIAALAGCLGDASTVGGADEPTATETAHDDDHGSETETHHDHEEHTHDAIEGPKPTAEVRMISTDAGEHFDPHVVWVEEGGTVAWTNESGAHSVTAYAAANDRPNRIPGAAESFDSGTLTEQGATYEMTFDEPGVYDYFCLPHETIGMIGSIIVGEPDPHDQPGLAEPQSELAEPIPTKLSKLNAQCNEALGHTHDAEKTESGHDEGSHDESDGHHDGGTETEHHEDDGHHDDETETDHHDD